MKTRVVALALALSAAACSLLTSLGGLGAPDGSVDAASDVSACTADIDNDPANCGRCNHGCQGGACQQGMCQPIALATGQPTPNGLALDDTYAFWSFDNASTGAIVRATKADGGNLASVANVTYVDRLLMQGPNLFGVGQSQNSPVFVIKNPDGADAATSLTSAPFYLVGGLASDGTNIYFIGAEDLTLDAGLQSVPVGGGPPKRIASCPTSPLVAAGNGSVFWWDGAAIVRVSTSGAGVPTVVVSNVTDIADLGFIATSDGPIVVWVAQQEGTVKLAPADGTTSSPRVLATAQAGPSYLALEAARVYWTNAVDGTVMACDLASGATPVKLASGQSKPLSIATDATSVFWVNSDSASVMKLAK